MSEEKSQCTTCQEKIDATKLLDLLVCCSTPEEIHLEHNECYAKWDKNRESEGHEPNCMHCRKSHVDVPRIKSLSLTARYLVKKAPKKFTNLRNVTYVEKEQQIINKEFIDVDGVKLYIDLLRWLHNHSDFSFTKADDHGKSFRDYFYQHLKPDNDFYYAIQDFLTEIDASYDPETLKSDDFSFTQKRLLSIQALRGMIQTMSLSQPVKTRSFLWDARSFLTHIYDTKVAKTIDDITNPDVLRDYGTRTQLSHAYPIFSSIDRSTNLLGLYFMAQIQFALNCPDKCVVLCKMILEQHPKLGHYQPMLDINDACFKFAAAHLKKMDQKTSGAYLLYQAKHSGQNEYPTTKVIAAICTADRPMIKEGLQYILDSNMFERSKDHIEVIKMAIHLLKKNQYCDELRAVLDRFKLTSLFQKPSSDYSAGGLFKSFFTASKDDLSFEFAEAITDADQPFLMQTRHCANFFQQFDFENANACVNKAYKIAKAQVDSKGVWVNRSY